MIENPATPDIQRRSREAGGCIGCVIPCGALVFMGLLAAGSVAAFAVHLMG